MPRMKYHRWKMLQVSIYTEMRYAVSGDEQAKESPLAKLSGAVCAPV